MKSISLLENFRRNETNNGARIELQPTELEYTERGSEKDQQQKTTRKGRTFDIYSRKQTQ